MSFRDFAPRSGPPRPGPPPGLEFEDADGGLPRSSPRRAASASGGRDRRRYHGVPCSRSRSDASAPRRDAPHGPGRALVQQREEEYALRVMREREAELRDIRRKMHAVDAIYRELGEVVEGQQGQVDQIEEEVGRAAEDARRGAERIAQANAGRGRRGGQASEAGPGADKKQQFCLLRYLARSAAEVSKAVSACTGGAAYGRPD